MSYYQEKEKAPKSSAKLLEKCSDTDYRYYSNASGNSVKELKQNARQASWNNNVRGKNITLQLEDNSEMTVRV